MLNAMGPVNVKQIVIYINDYYVYLHIKEKIFSILLFLWTNLNTFAQTWTDMKGQVDTQMMSSIV